MSPFARDGAGYFHNFLEPYDFDAVRREVEAARLVMERAAKERGPSSAASGVGPLDDGEEPSPPAAAATWCSG